MTSCKRAVFDCDHLGEGLVSLKVWRSSLRVLPRSGTRENLQRAPLTFFQQPQILSRWETWSLISHGLDKWR